ncbi:MAG TPA: ABC transporter ATP-binding protein [Gaiellaceae bacterium]|nr:ABC transporter ATP-binding protein [Gaiellaceae bacterium]
MRGAAVAVRGVCKSFERGRIRAVVDATFDVAPGESVALTGPSGSGKSTLLNLIGALDVPDAGEVVVDGRSLSAVRDRAEYRATTVGFVFQSHDLIPTLTAAENVQVPMLGRGPGRAERRRRALELLEEVGLSHRVDARPATLSAGERQRVALARALANMPRLILADEPTGALDTAAGMHVVELLHELRERHGTTLLVVTHDPAVAARSDRALAMQDGVIRAEAPRLAPA